MTKVSLEFQAAELLRHPHLQAYLVKCRNLSPVFLPVKLDKNGRDRPTLLDGEDDIRRRIVKNRQETKTQEGKSLSSSSTLTISCETEMGGERMMTNKNGERMTDSPRSTLHDHLIDVGKKEKEKEKEKEGEGRSSHERAEAMESLLELCAELLREERIEELYGVLKPFTEEAVSSRETAIWLTKGLMSVHNNSSKKEVNKI